MNTKTTLLLAIVALGATAWFVYDYKQAQKPAGDEKKAPESVAKDLFTSKPTGVDRVEVAKGSNRYTFRKEGDGWSLVEPIEAPANEFEVNALVDRVTGIKYTAAFEKDDKNRPSDEVAGFNNPEGTVKLYAGDKLVGDVILGKGVPTGKGSYVRLASEDTVYEASDDLSSLVKRRLDDYRNKRVLKFELKDIRRVKFEGGPNYELSHSGDQWTIETPVRGPGDKAKVENVVRPLTTLTAQDWKDAEFGLKVYNLDKPRLTVTIETSREIPPKAKPGDPNTQPADTQPSQEERTYTLLIGGVTDNSGTAYFAKLEHAPWVFSLPEYTVKELFKEPTELRDPQIAKIENTGAVNMILAHTPGGIMTLTKNEKAEWHFEDGTVADTAAVEDLIKAVQNLRASEYADASDPLVQSDWQIVRGKITLSRGSEAPVTVLIGNTSASGKMVYVKNQNQDAVAIVRQTEAEQLLLPPIAYRDRTVVRIPREQVRKIEVTRADGPAVTVSRDSAVAPWQMTAPVTAAADADATRNLLSDLAALRAKRVVAVGKKGDYGLDKPQVRLVVHTESPAPPANAEVVPSAPEPAPQAAPTTAPAAPAATAPATRAADNLVPPGSTVEREIEKHLELLEFQKTNPKENPLATQMLRDRLARLQAMTQPAGAATTQPTISGAPQSAPASAPAVTKPETVTRVYRLALSQRDGVTYASLEDNPTVYEVEAKVFEDATAEMHDRQILKFEVANVREITFERGEGAVLSLAKQGDEWKYQQDPLVPIDGQKVTEVLNVFRDLKTHRYVSYTSDDLAKYGLDKDVEKFVVRLEGGTRSEVVLSKKTADDADKSRYATVTGQPGVFLLKPDQATKFGQKLEDFEKTATAATGG